MTRVRKRLLTRIRRKLPWKPGKSDFQVQKELIARAQYVADRLLNEMEKWHE